MVFEFLPEEKEAIFKKYHFHEIDLRSEAGKQLFLDNLRQFRANLIRDKIENEELDILRDIVLGKHPTGGQIKSVLPEWNQKRGGWKIHLNVKPKNHMKNLYKSYMIRILLQICVLFPLKFLKHKQILCC